MSLALSNEFKQMIGGMYAAVLPFDNGHISDRTLLTRLLRDAIEHEAKVHGADFDRQGFNKFMRALGRNQNIRVNFYIAAWDVCEPIGLGAQVQYDALYVRQIGTDLKVGRGVYTEDVCIPPDTIRQLIADKSVGRSFSRDTGLGAHYDLESMKLMASGPNPAMGRFGEVSPSNTKIIRILNQFGAAIGTEKDSAVLELNGLPAALQDKWKPTVETHDVPLGNGRKDPNNFYVSWASPDREQQIVVTYTKTISTFTGKPIVRGQIVGNGNLPEKGMLACVLSSMLQAGEKKIGEEQWGVPQEELVQSVPSPSIPLLGTKQEKYLALVNASGQEISLPKINQNKAHHIFGGPIPTTRFHVLREPEILSVLQERGVQKRILGNHAMQPADIDFTEMAKKVPGFKAPAPTFVSPLRHERAPNGLILSFAA